MAGRCRNIFVDREGMCESMNGEKEASSQVYVELAKLGAMVQHNSLPRRKM